MEYQETADFLDNEVAPSASNQSSKFRTRDWVEINDEIRGVYSSNKQIRFKTSMLRSRSSDAYVLVKGNLLVNNTAGTSAAVNNIDTKIIFKNCAPFTNCISKINNSKVDNAKDIDIVMSMYNLIEYNDNYSKTSRSLWQYCKDILAVNKNSNIVGFSGANATGSLNFKTKITSQTDNNGRIDNVEIMVPLKYLSNLKLIVKVILILKLTLF